MVREGWTFTRVTDTEAFERQEYDAWQALSIGERLRISMEMNEAIFNAYGRTYEAVGGRERLQRSADSL